IGPTDPLDAFPARVKKGSEPRQLQHTAAAKVNLPASHQAGRDETPECTRQTTAQKNGQRQPVPKLLFEFEVNRVPTQEIHQTVAQRVIRAPREVENQTEGQTKECADQASEIHFSRE